MSVDSLFAAARLSNQALIGRIRSLLENLRRIAPVLAPGCGCLLPMAAVSVRDFEEALLLHITERARVLGKEAGIGPPDGTSLDDFLEWMETCDSEALAQSFCRPLLEEMQRSVLSFSSQCAVHPVRAAAI
jgi:hypothetical protein